MYDRDKILRCGEIASTLNYASAGMHAFYRTAKTGHSNINYGLIKLRNIAEMIDRYGVDEFIKDISSHEAFCAVYHMEKESGWTL